MTTIKRILCPSDLSGTSSAGLTYAIDLAEKLEAEVTVLHAYQIPVFAFPGSTFIPNAAWTTDIMDQAQREFDRWVAKHQKDTTVKLSSKLVQGDIYAEINQAADEIQADLIVMGTHGRKGFSHFLMGSVAERVVRTSKAAVITVRAEAPSKAQVAGRVLSTT